jgi:hypothetical protein
MEVANRLGIGSISKLRKEELIQLIQNALQRSVKRKGGATMAEKTPSTPTRTEGDKAQGEDEATQSSGHAVEPGPTEATEATEATEDASGDLVEETAEAIEAAPDEAGQTNGGEVSPRPEQSELISAQSKVTAAKYRVGTPYGEEELRQVDTHLPGLPEGYGEDRLVLLPRDPYWLYAYWDIRGETKEEAQRSGGKNLSLRLFVLHGDELEPLAEHWCQELSRSWYLQVPSPGQTYAAEIGYRAVDGSWLSLLRSNTVKVPTAMPSAQVADEFLTLPPDQPLLGSPPEEQVAPPEPEPEPSPLEAEPIEAAAPAEEPPLGEPETAEAPPADDGAAHEEAYLASLGDWRTSAPGSLGAPPPPAPGLPAISSPQAGPSWAGSQHLTGRGSEAEGEGGFWLMADAELVVFGATEPDARVTLGGQPIKLRSDGTFSARMAFPDGEIVVPIVAISADGVDRREVEMRFERATTEGSEE